MSLNYADQKKVGQLCNVAGKPHLAAGFIAAGTPPDRVTVALRDDADRRVRASAFAAAQAQSESRPAGKVLTASPNDREADRESMRRQVRAHGMTPRTDPGAGLPPAQASMKRLLATGAR